MKNLLISFLLIIVFLGLIAGKPDCGKWRWAVKTLTDGRGESILKAQPRATTIDELVRLHAPLKMSTKTMKDGSIPRQPTEGELVVVNASIVKYKLESDGDIHIVIRSESGANMVAEIPDPNCSAYDAHPIVRAKIDKARKFFINSLEKGNISNRFRQSSYKSKIKIVGVPFWDGAHSSAPDGAAANFRELHPVVDLIKSN